MKLSPRGRFRDRFVLGVALIALLSYGSTEAFSQQRRGKPRPVRQTRQQPVATSQAPTATPAKKLTVWSLLGMTDWLFWPFVLLTGTGTTFLAFRFLLDYRDRERSKILLAQQINPSTLNQIGGLLNMGQPSRASRMFTLMIMTFNKTGRAENLTDDMNSFLADDRQTYETFNRVMSFLSDSAGALGLLGTVWGIFVTFYAGKLDGETILKGMSVSLMTTLVGLIISLLLNLGSTTAFAWYNSQMKLLSARAEDLRQALLGFQRGHVPNRKNGSSAKRAQTPAEEFAGTTSQYREQYSGHEY